MNSKLNPEDIKIFRGSAGAIQDWQTPEEILAMMDCDFEVEVRPYVDHLKVTHPKYNFWHRSDRQDSTSVLGMFGSRIPIQPIDHIKTFQSFINQCPKEISMDVFGCFDNGKSIYMASKLTDNNGKLYAGEDIGMGISSPSSPHYIPKEQRTDQWLVLTDTYGKVGAPTINLLSVECVCTNGMSRRMNQYTRKLHHRGEFDSELVIDILSETLREAHSYESMKDKMISTPITNDMAMNVISKFSPDKYDPETKEKKRNNKRQSLRRIFEETLIGGEQNDRQNNLWRVMNTFTQYHSHACIHSTNREKALMSNLNGIRSKEISLVRHELEGLLTLA